MGIGNDDGTHELYLASVFPDGTRGATYRLDQAAATYSHDDQRLPAEQWRWWHVDAVTRFAVTCECALPDGIDPRPTVLTTWVRVDDPGREDLDFGGRLYVAPGQNAMDVSDRPQVEAQMRWHWLKHLAPERTTRDLQTAWARSQQALAEVDEAVFAMRRTGLSWADVGRATGMTRQSARERWGSRFAAVEAQAHEAQRAALGLDDIDDSWERAEHERWREESR